MGYSFNVTAKRDIGGGKSKIPKGCTVQVFEKSSSGAQVPTIRAAFERHLGIEVKGYSLSTSYFEIEKL